MPDLSRADGEPAMLAMVVPILPGKLDQWRAVMHDLVGPRRDDWQVQRRRLGLRERLFLQHTPNGAVAIVVLEGRDLQRRTDRSSRRCTGRSTVRHGLGGR